MSDIKEKIFELIFINVDFENESENNRNQCKWNFRKEKTRKIITQF